MGSSRPSIETRRERRRLFWLHFRDDNFWCYKAVCRHRSRSYQFLLQDGKWKGGQVRYRPWWTKKELNLGQASKEKSEKQDQRVYPAARINFRFLEWGTPWASGPILQDFHEINQYLNIHVGVSSEHDFCVQYRRYRRCGWRKWWTGHVMGWHSLSGWLHSSHPKDVGRQETYSYYNYEESDTKIANSFKS